MNASTAHPRRWLAAFGAAFILASGAAADDSLPRWTLQFPPDAPLPFTGIVNLDEDGMAAQPITYQAPNAGGVIAAIVAHSLIVDTTRKIQRNKLIAAANEVIAPYRGVLDGFGHPELRQRVHKRLGVEGADGELVVESAPMFALTQDEKAIVLDNAIVFRGTQAGPQGVYQSVLRVVSDPIKGSEPRGEWLANSGEKLKDTCAQLVADSVAMALLDARGSPEPAAAKPTHRTVRYAEGGTERMERATVIRQQCGRLIIRNLRGHLMSVPTQAAVTDCPP